MSLLNRYLISVIICTITFAVYAQGIHAACPAGWSSISSTTSWTATTTGVASIQDDWVAPDDGDYVRFNNVSYFAKKDVPLTFNVSTGDTLTAIAPNTLCVSFSAQPPQCGTITTSLPQYIYGLTEYEGSPLTNARQPAVPCHTETAPAAGQYILTIDGLAGTEDERYIEISVNDVLIHKVSEPDPSIPDNPIIEEGTIQLEVTAPQNGTIKVCSPAIPRTVLLGSGGIDGESVVWVDLTCKQSCTPPSVPSNISFTCNGVNSTNLTWENIPGANSYSINIDNVDDPSHNWSTGTCPASTTGPGDHCFVSITNSYSFTTNPNQMYTAQIQAKNPCGTTSSFSSWTAQSLCSAEWYKLKNASFHRQGSLQMSIPSNITRFDNDDTTEMYPLSVNAGVMTASSTPISVASTTNSVSNVGWNKDSFNDENSFLASLPSFLEYAKLQKKTQIITSVSEIQSDIINIFEGNLIINNSNQLPSNENNYVLIVNGNLTLEDMPGNSERFNNQGRSIAVMTTGAFNIHSDYDELTGIFISQSINLGYDTPAVDTRHAKSLKIVGNLISATPIDDLRRINPDTTKPTLFIVFRPDFYVDLLTLLSTIVRESTQIE